MLGLKSILLLALSVSTICDITDKDSLIYRILQGFAKQAPELEKEVQKPETYPTSEIRQIVSRGFTYYKESSAAVQYSGVEAANLDAFLSYALEPAHLFFAGDMVAHYIQRALCDVVPPSA